MNNSKGKQSNKKNAVCLNKKLLLVAIGSIGIVLFLSWVIHMIDNDIVTGAWAVGIACGIFIQIGSGAIVCSIKDSKWFKSMRIKKVRKGQMKSQKKLVKARAERIWIENNSHIHIFNYPYYKFKRWLYSNIKSSVRRR